MKAAIFAGDFVRRFTEARDTREIEIYGRVLTPEERIAKEEAEDREAERIKEESRRARIEARLKEFPRRYADKTFANFKASTPSQRQIVKHLKDGGSAVIYGGNGTGKTHLAFAAVRNQIESGKDSKYVLAYDFFTDIKNSFSDSSTEAVMRRYEGCDYLVIDEVDKSFGTVTEFVYLYTLVNRRYNNLRPTVLITNASEKDLVTVIGASTISRIGGDGAVIELVGEDYRLKG